LICQIIIFFTKFEEFSAYFSNSKAGVIAIYLPIAIICLIAQSFLTAVIIKWFTVLSNIEMKRNEKNVKKVIAKQTLEANKKAESVYKSFQLLFLQYKISDYNSNGNNKYFKGKNSEDFVLEEAKFIGKVQMQQLIDLSLRRFKFVI